MKSVKLIVSILLLSSILNLGCNSKETIAPYIEVITNNDTIDVDSVFEAKIYLRNYSPKNVQPAFYYPHPYSEKSYIPYENEYWTFKARHSSEGIRVFLGFAEYDSAGYTKILPVEFEYYVSK